MYTAPVCGRISNTEDEEWFDFENDCLACKEARVVSGEVAYKRGTCASNQIQTKEEREAGQKNNIYDSLLGNELEMYDQHYGMAGRKVTIIVEFEDIKYIDKISYNGMPSWRVTVTREMEGTARTVYIYYDETGTERLGEQQIS